jgi:excisionase family DNA binding protein
VSQSATPQPRSRHETRNGSSIRRPVRRLALVSAGPAGESTDGSDGDVISKPRTCRLAVPCSFVFFDYYGVMSILADHTVLPPDLAQSAQLHDLADLLSADTEFSLVTPDGRTFALSDELRNVLVHAGKALSEGQAVSIEAHRAVLSTQEAADLLGVSRPTVVKLLESGEMAFTKPGRHRRVLLEDLLAYQRRVQVHRRDELAAMSAEAATDDGYRAINGFKQTR